MADDEDEMYLENLDEFVNDEDKIVTYKWLSRTLSVTANRAKQMLYKFVNQQKMSRPDSKLNVTYLIGGHNANNGEMVQRYVIAHDQDLQETKKQLSTVTSVHIYSVQKCNLKDSNPLYYVDYSIQQEHKHSTKRLNHIHCKAAEKLREGRLPKSSNNVDGPQPQSQKVTNGFHDPSAAESNYASTRPEQSHKSAPASKKSGGSNTANMKSFFAQRGTAGKKTSENEVKEGDKKEQDNKSNVLHSKSEEKKNETIKNEPKKRRVSTSGSSDEEEPLPKKFSKSVTAGKERKLNKDKKNQESRSKDIGKGTKSQKARRKFKALVNDSDEEEEEKKQEITKPKKKRKRMKEIPKEESSNEERVEKENQATENSPDINDNSDSDSPIPNHQPERDDNTVSRKRKRTKVMRSKTYIDDDGFMVTEKVWESDSTDASDVETEDKQTSPENVPESNKALSAAFQNVDSKATKQKKNKSTTAANKQVKQSSLMSFFKKT